MKDMDTLHFSKFIASEILKPLFCAAETLQASHSFSMCLTLHIVYCCLYFLRLFSLYMKPDLCDGEYNGLIDSQLQLRHNGRMRGRKVGGLDRRGAVSALSGRTQAAAGSKARCVMVKVCL